MGEEIKMTINVPKRKDEGLSEFESMCKTLGIEKWERTLIDAQEEYPLNDCFKCEHCKVCDVLLTCLEGKELEMASHFFVCEISTADAKYNIIPFESQGGKEFCEDFSPIK